MSIRTTGMGGHQSAAAMKDEWLTPLSILRALGPFDLDPCAPIAPPWPTANRTFTIRDNGLIQPWSGFVWCNPPYGAKTGDWLGRLADHGSGIALIFARTETEMFFDQVWRRASSMLFFEGRLYFHHVDGRRARANAGAPSVLVGYGPEADRRLASSGIAGSLVTGWKAPSVGSATLFAASVKQ